MDERTERMMGPEGGITRRVITRGAAAGGLAALFAAAGAGRALAHDGEDEADDTVDTVDTVDEADTADTVDTVDTVDDDKSVVAPTGGSRIKGKRSGKRGKGRH